jgi:hypothetical protein
MRRAGVKHFLFCSVMRKDMSISNQHRAARASFLAFLHLTPGPASGARHRAGKVKTRRKRKTHNENCDQMANW